MCEREEWLREKSRAIEKIREDSEIGYLDARVVPLLEALNSLEEFYTTSSCSGRVTVVDAEWPWEREESHVVFKSHEKVEAKDVLRVVSVRPLRAYWLIARGPILHVVSRDVSSAMALLAVARETGFKHSGVVGRTACGYLVEIMCSPQLIVPLVVEGNALMDRGSTATLINLANLVLEEGWSRLERLASRLKEVKGLAHTRGKGKAIDKRPGEAAQRPKGQVE